jgi:RNA polymerase sigma factor (TIGR02999 family)
MSHGADAPGGSASDNDRRAEETTVDVATAALFESVYTELRAVADGFFRRKRQEDTLQPTALVHEAYLKLASTAAASFRSRKHFIAVAATAMRQILVDRERRRTSRKRDAGTRITITRDLIAAPDQREILIDLLTLDDALRALAKLNARHASIVELLYFGGLTVDETAEVLEISSSLAEKEWRRARAWLREKLASSFA